MLLRLRLLRMRLLQVPLRMLRLRIVMWMRLIHRQLPEVFPTIQLVIMRMMCRRHVL